MTDCERGHSFIVGEDDNKEYVIGLYTSAKTPLRVVFKEFTKVGPQVFDKEFRLDLSDEKLASLGLTRRHE